MPKEIEFLQGETFSSQPVLRHDIPKMNFKLMRIWTQNGSLAVAVGVGNA